jgi:hypothetical protein
MAKVKAPFILSGTLDDLNFMDTTEGNFVREKREDYMTTEEFMANPLYDPIREQAKEMGYCALKSRMFRQLAVAFYRNSKEVSFAGRANQILFEIIGEDKVHPKGLRTLEEGMQSPFLHEIILGFEGNKHRPLSKVLRSPFGLDTEARTLTLADLNAAEHLDWPAEATHAHLAMATASWDYVNDAFDSRYSEEIILERESVTQTLRLATAKPKEHRISLSYLYIGFAKKERRKYKLLHRRSNTVSIIGYVLHPAPAQS